jgi:DNA-binding NarL/FixJ family response regulator
MAHALVGIVATENCMFGLGLASLLKRDQNFERIQNVQGLSDALDYLQSLPTTKLLAIDFAIDGASEYSFLHELRAKYPMLKVIAISNDFDRDEMIKALSAGVHGYVPSNMSYNEISNALDQVLSGNIYIPPKSADLDTDQQSIGHSGNIVPLQPALKGMSLRQQQVLRLIANGESNKSIARKLQLSEGTVKAHVSAVFQKMGVHSRAAAAALHARIVKF